MKILFLVLMGVVLTQLMFAQTTLNFTSDDFTMIANPERGFCSMVYPTWTEPPTATRALTQADCDRAKGKLYSVIGIRYVFWDWRTSDLPAWLLNQIKSDCDLARTNGLKLWVRMSYVYATNGGTNAYYNGISDAPESWVLRHIDQLTTNGGANNGPLYVSNDVVAYWDLGFIGPWGEEHHSSNNLLNNPDPYAYATMGTATHNIWNTLLNKIPSDRMIATRYCAFKKEKFGGATLTAPTTDNIGRIGIHDDSFCANVDNFGSFQTGAGRVDELRTYCSNETKYTVSYGETYGYDPNYPKQEDGNTVISEMQAFHLDFYNGEHDQTSSYAVTLDKWEAQGLLSTMKNKIGYRLHVISASAPSSLSAGASGTLNFKIENRGWGKLFNPRPVKLLICRKSGGTYAEKYTVSTSINPRLWYAGTQKDESISFTMPTEAPAGTYDLLLQLPDAYSSLQENSAYSVRFASKYAGGDIWSAGLGANWVGSLTVGSGGTIYYRIKNRWQPTYYMYDNGNQLGYGTNPDTDYTTHWSIETVDGYSCLKNRSTGHYMNNETSQLYTECTAVPNSYWSAQWTIVDYAGYKRIQNRWKNTEYLHLENLSGYVQHTNTVPADYWSGQWTLETTLKSASIATEIDVTSDKGIEVYPNPVGFYDQLTFKSGSVKQSKIVICDLQGRIIYNSTFQSQLVISPSEINLVTGVFMVRVETENKISSHKIVVK